MDIDVVSCFIVPVMNIVRLVVVLESVRNIAFFGYILGYRMLIGSSGQKNESEFRDGWRQKMDDSGQIALFY